MDDATATYLATTTPCPCGDGSCNSCDDNGRVPVGYWSAEAQESRWQAQCADADATSETAPPTCPCERCGAAVVVGEGYCDDDGPQCDACVERGPTTRRSAVLSEFAGVFAGENAIGGAR